MVEGRETIDTSGMTPVGVALALSVVREVTYAGPSPGAPLAVEDAMLEDTGVTPAFSDSSTFGETILTAVVVGTESVVGRTVT